MQRKQFTFYRSYFEAVSCLPKKIQTQVLLAICDYALNETEPSLEGSALAVFTLVRPTLDAGRRRAESGSLGGMRKQSASNTQANSKQTAREKEKEKELEKESEIETETENDSSSPLANVVRAYLNKINPQASQMCLEELKAFCEEMGEACCLRAMDIALDAKKTSWSYIRAILRDKKAAGVRCLADWDKADAKHRQGKASGITDFERDAVKRMMGE